MKPISSNIKDAKTLNGDFYTSKDYLNKAKIKIFESSWQLLSDTSHLSSVGFKKPIQFLEPLISEPLVLIKQKDLTIKCLSNVCTHRGNILVNEKNKSKEIVCKYHGRRFNNCGKLLSMPEFSDVNNFPTENDHLTEIPLKNWKQFLFSSMNPTYKFDELIKEMDNRIGWMPIEKFKFDPNSSKDYFVNANWALYCDNYLEGFHIPFVHGALNKTLDYDNYQTELSSFSVLQLGYAEENSICFDFPIKSIDYGKKIAAYYYWLFPNMMFNFYPWGLSVNIVKPIKYNLTKVEFRSYVWDKSKRQSGAGSILDKVEMEDEKIVENVQKGVGSKFYKNGRFSPKMEKGVHHFHKLISEFLVL
jgi:choline monooxygenase